MTLPPLPEKVQIDKHESGYVIRGYTTDQMEAYAQAAQQARQPLDRWQIADILARERMQWTKSQPLFEFEFGEAIARAVERAHGIGDKG